MNMVIGIARTGFFGCCMQQSKLFVSKILKYYLLVRVIVRTHTAQFIPSQIQNLATPTNTWHVVRFYFNFWPWFEFTCKNCLLHQWWGGCSASRRLGTRRHHRAHWRCPGARRSVTTTHWVWNLSPLRTAGHPRGCTWSGWWHVRALAAWEVSERNTNMYSEFVCEMSKQEKFALQTQDIKQV